jgi:hypothetical protein
MSEINKLIADAKFTSILPVSVKPAGDSALKLEQLIGARNAQIPAANPTAPKTTLSEPIIVVKESDMASKLLAYEEARKVVGVR